MKQAVDDRGMTPLVAGTAEDAIQRTVDELHAMVHGRTPTPSTFDPLMAMCNNFYRVGLERTGLTILAMKDEKAKEFDAQWGLDWNDGHFCPLCLAKAGWLRHAKSQNGMCGEPECKIVVPPDSQQWDAEMITSCADAMLAHARQVRLLPPLQ